MYIIIKTLSRLVCMLPAALCDAIGFVIGRLSWLAVQKWRRQMAVDNVIKSGLAATPAAAESIVRESVYRFGPMMLEVLMFPQLTKEKIDGMVKITGGEYLREALTHGRGAVLITAHSGNWELLGATLAFHGYPIVAVVKKQSDLGADRFINEYRTLAGMHVTYKTSVREMVRLLGEGKIVGLLMDQDAGADGVVVDFFGRPASSPQGPAALARMKESPIVPAFMTRKADGTHEATIHPLLWPVKPADREQDIVQTTNKLNRIIEDHIRQHPAEWFWLHNRWKV